MSDNNNALARSAEVPVDFGSSQILGVIDNFDRMLNVTIDKAVLVVLGSYSLKVIGNEGGHFISLSHAQGDPESTSKITTFFSFRYEGREYLLQLDQRTGNMKITRDVEAEER